MVVLEQVTIGQLTEICRRQRRGSRKPPWIEDEEDRRFTGYETVQQALDAIDVDVKKVPFYAVTLRRLMAEFHRNSFPVASPRDVAHLLATSP